MPRLMPWLRTNLFSTWYNSALTLLCVWGLYQIGSGLLVWAMTIAQWQVIFINLRSFMVGRYPMAQLWRIWLNLVLVIIGLGVSWWLRKRNQGNWLSLVWLLLFMAIVGLTASGSRSQDWNGLLLTLLLAGLGILVSFPLGVLLALGRTSDLPVFRWASVAYIELVRGVPLIAILFMAQVMLPLFLPNGWQFDRVARAIAGFSLFSAAYMAENVRGGLQAVPIGQREAAAALGLSDFEAIVYIILPQALKAVLPAITGQCIGLLMDTSLASQVGLLELTGISRSVLAQPEFLGRYAEVYLFIALIYWLFCYAISWGSRKLEQKLAVNLST